MCKNYCQCGTNIIDSGNVVESSVFDYDVVSGVILATPQLSKTFSASIMCMSHFCLV